MGHPRQHRPKWSRPLKPFDKNRIESESKIIQQFGLRRKHELWRAEGIVRDFRRRARELAASPNQKLRDELFARLKRLRLDANTIDEILALKTEDELNRRLQTILVKQGLAKTLAQARQLIVHRHVKVGDRVIRWPSTVVPAEFEDKIEIVQKAKKIAVGSGEKT